MPDHSWHELAWWLAHRWWFWLWLMTLMVVWDPPFTSRRRKDQA